MIRLPLRGPLRLALAALFAVLSIQAWAVEPFQIRDIRVEGLERTDPGTVFSVLPFRIGDTYTEEKGATALRALFGTGLFKDVRLKIDGDVAVIVIDERSVVASVNFVGAKEFDAQVLSRALKDAGIAEGLPRELQGAAIEGD